MLTTTRDMVLPTAITGSYPRPLWYNANLNGDSFKSAMGDSLFREQYLDAVAAIINAQEAAGLDILTDGDSRFDLAVGGKSWFFYPIERLGGVTGHRDTSRGWMQRHGLKPGKILWEVQEAYQPGVVTDKLSRGPLEYTAIWQIAQRLSDKPVKFGAICAPALASMLWDEHYHDDKALVLDLCDIMNAEFRELAAAGCPVIQVEEPRHHDRLRLRARGSVAPHRLLQMRVSRRGHQYRAPRIGPPGSAYPRRRPPPLFRERCRRRGESMTGRNLSWLEAGNLLWPCFISSEDRLCADRRNNCAPQEHTPSAPPKRQSPGPGQGSSIARPRRACAPRRARRRPVRYR